MANKKQEISLDDVRTSLNVCKKYFEQNRTCKDKLAHEFVKILGQETLWLKNRYTKYNPMTQLNEHVQKNGWLPYIVNKDGLVKHIKLADISEYMEYRQGNINYTQFVINGERYTAPGERNDMQILHWWMSKHGMAEDWCIDIAYASDIKIGEERICI